MNRAAFLCCLIVAANVVIWAWALVTLHQVPLLLGTALVVYGLGARHAVDADHIAAIDNATRKLLQSGGDPAGSGLYFSLGHSSVVIAGSLALLLLTHDARAHALWLMQAGGILGTAISVGFLFAIAAANAWLLRDKLLRRADAASVAGPAPGPMTRILRPLLRMITRSWHMLPLGALFALGFDSVSEVAVMALSSAQSISGVPRSQVLALPLLFAAGMVLVDTCDSALMARAYGWALTEPRRRRRYDLTVTALSVCIALAVGTLEALGLLASRLDFHGQLWRAVSAINERFGAIGCGIIVAFLLCFALAIALQPRRPALLSQPRSPP